VEETDRNKKVQSSDQEKSIHNFHQERHNCELQFFPVLLVLTFGLAQHRNTAYNYFVYMNKETFRILWFVGNHILTHHKRKILKTMQEALTTSQRKYLSR